MVDFQRFNLSLSILRPSKIGLTKRMRSRYRLAAIFSRVHRFIYVLFNGRFLSRRGSANFLLLTTKGRRSRRNRTVPLLYVPHLGDPAVVASFGGHPKAPAWLLNIRNDPKVMVQAGAERWDGIARFATEDDRRELWPRFVDVFSGYERYRTRTTRQFPIVIITRAEDQAVGSA